MNILEENNYPPVLVAKHVEKLREQFKNRQYSPRKANEENTRKRICLPSCELSKKLAVILKQWNIETTYKETRTIFSIFPSQHEKPKNLEQAGIYTIKCSGCDEAYIGETCRKIRTRISEHKHCCKIMDTQRSELAEHILQTGHTINWDDVARISGYGENSKKRKIMEACEILTRTNVMNRRLEEGRMSDNMVYMINQIGKRAADLDTNASRAKRPRIIQQWSVNNLRKRLSTTAGGDQRNLKRRRIL